MSINKKLYRRRKRHQNKPKSRQCWVQSLHIMEHFQLISAIVRNLEDGKLTMGLLLDLSKAYDSLDRDLLIKKLEKYGIRGNALLWFKSFLNNRHQRVTLRTINKNINSDIMPCRYGLPQGSIISPVLFILYVNDLYDLQQTNKQIIGYADDTNLLVGQDSIEALQENTNGFLSTVDRWLKENRLILNEKKTNAIMFRTKQNKVEKDPQIILNCNMLEIISHARFLGIEIDEFLDWSCHINQLRSKLSRISFAIRVLVKYMDKEVLRIVYFANFQSVMQFGIIFWGKNSDMQKIFVMQKCIVRAIYGKKFNETCRGIFRSKRILTVYGLYIFHCLMFFVKHKHLFDTKQRHRYNTRTLDVMYPIHHLTLSEKSPYYMCIKCYNTLPVELKDIQSQKIFKRKIKLMLIELEPYSLGDYFNM